MSSIDLLKQKSGGFRIQWLPVVDCVVNLERAEGRTTIVYRTDYIIPTCRGHLPHYDTDIAS